MVLKELKLLDCFVFYWADAASVLHLISSDEKRYKIFVANRLSLIRQYSSPDQWHFCPTSLNAADVGTRSISADGVDMMKTWINGPSFLNQLELENFDVFRKPNEIALCAFRSDELSNCDQVPLLLLISHYSIWSRLLRAVVLLTRFKKVLQCLVNKSQVSLGKITANDLSSAERDVCRLVQSDSFSFVIQYLNGGKVVSDYKNELKSILKLSPFLDEKGIIRVGGRLQRSSNAYNFKHPILLPKRGQVTKLIVVYFHKLLRHSGYNSVLARIRQTFWIINGISAVRHYLKDCFFCNCRRAGVGQQQMAPLPRERVTSGGRPFEITGVDFCGPEFVFVSFGQSRTRKKVKRYGCLFTCFATRAVHLEVCNALTTDSFLCALNRFLCSRGFATRQIWSDNGTNLVGADNEIKEAGKKIDGGRLCNALSPRGVEWRFSPPRSPHQSGVWEVMV